MNVFILTDLEGIAGVNSITCMERGSEDYKRACLALCHSINLAADTCFTCGADAVYYLDGHGGGGNVDESLIDPRAVKCDIAKWQSLLQTGGVDCQIELGCHARAGTMGGFLDHTFSSKAYFSQRINGREMSELSCHAIVCAAYGVPLIACIGDRASCEQAAEYVPGIFTGIVKHAERRNSATDVQDPDRVLVETIRAALDGKDRVELFSLPAPHTVELTFYRTDMCDKSFDKGDPTVERVDARTLRRRVARILRYEDLKF